MKDELRVPRARTGGATDDIEPMSLIVSTISRWSWLILLVGLAGGLAAYGLLARSDDARNATATARLGLTDEVVWPFYDAARDRLQTTLTDEVFEAQIEQETGVEIVELRMDVPINQAFVDIVAVAGSLPDAVLVADAAAAELIVRSQNSRAAALTIDLESFDTQLDELKVELDTLQATLDQTIEEKVAAQDGLIDNPGDAVLRQRVEDLEANRQTFQNQIGILTSTQTTVQVERDNVARQLAAVQPEAELLRRADGTEPSDSSNTLATAVIAGLLAAGLAALAVVIADREFGRVRTAWHLRGPVGLPVIGDIELLDDGGYRGLAATADRMLDELSAGRRVFGLIGDADSSGHHTAEVLAVALRRVGLTTMTISSPGEPDTDPVSPGVGSARTHLAIPEGARIEEIEQLASALDRDAKWLDVALVDLDPEYASPDSFRIRSRLCDGMILAVSRGRARVRPTRARSTTLSGLGEYVVGAVLVDPLDRGLPEPKPAPRLRPLRRTTEAPANIRSA